MTIADAIREAIRAGDGRLAGRAADVLRAKGLNYEDTFRAFKRNAPNPEAFAKSDFEALMQDADEQQSQNA